MSCVHREASRRKPLSIDLFLPVLHHRKCVHRAEAEESRLSRKLKRLQDYGNAVPSETAFHESELEPAGIAIASH
jgi:hypothetical protein